MWHFKHDKIDTNQTRRYWMGLLLILFIYILFYLSFAENPNAVLIPRKWRHIIKFAVTALVYLTGSVHLGKISALWMSRLWHFIHISLLTTITLIGIYDWIFGMVSLQTKEIAAAFQEFLISPILYIGMGIINNYQHQKEGPGQLKIKNIAYKNPSQIPQRSARPGA